MTSGGYPRVAWAAMARTAGRYPSGRFYDDLARLATSGAFDARQLIDCARQGRLPADVVLDPRGLAWFAHTTASRVETGSQAADTADLFALAYRVGRKRALARQLDTVSVQALHLAGRLDEFRGVLQRAAVAPAAWWAADTDDARPVDDEEDTARWLALLNRPFTEAGLEAFMLAPGTQAPFDRLIGEADSLPRSHPLVSVVVPVYNPGPSLRSTMRSLLNQTWTNTEIILSDDASTEGTDLIAELAGLDERVRVVRAPRNAGAYAARNLGLGVARGEYVTFNDADDISHPRRLERQLAVILADDAVRASMSQSIRLTSDLHLTVMGRLPERQNLSSIMLNRADVLTYLGGFDTVRKGADSEFVARFTAVFGQAALAGLHEPLALVQLTGGSLSRDDYRFLRTHPARLQYQAAFRRWHLAIDRKPDVAYVPPGTRAPFPAPDYITGAAVQPLEVDVVVLANLTTGAPSVPDLAAEVEALVQAGLRVGLLEYLGPFDLTDSVRAPTGALADLIHTGRAVRALPGDRVRARLAIVRDPAAVQTMPVAALEGLSADQVLVVADYAATGGAHYEPERVTTTLADQFGEVPTWLPATRGIHSELTPALTRSSAQLNEPALYGRVRRCRSRPGNPLDLRVGISLGSVQRMTPQELADRLRALMPSTANVLTYGQARQITAATPRPTLHLDSGEFSLEQFAEQVDVMVVDGTVGRGAHLDRAVLAALGSGSVPIVDGQLRGHLGGAALYRDEAPIDEHLARLSIEVDLRARIADQGRTLLDTALSTRALQRQITQIITTQREGHPMKQPTEGAPR